MAFKMKNSSMAKMVKAAGDNRAAMKMKMEAAAKMKAESAMKMKSPMEKELVGKQHNLPEELKAKIEAAPSKMRSRKGAMDTESPMKLKEKASAMKMKKSAMEMKEPMKMKKSAMKLKKAETEVTDRSALKKTYKQAFDDMEDYTDSKGKKFKKNKRSGKMYANSDAGRRTFIDEAKAYNKKTYGTTEPTKTKNEASKAMGEKVTKKDLKKGDYSTAISMDKKPKKTKAELAAEKQKQDDAKEGRMFSDKKRAAASTKTKKDDRKYRKAENKREKADKALAAGKFDKAQRKYRKALKKEEQGDKARRA
jgi:hypothetical protein